MIDQRLSLVLAIIGVTACGQVLGVDSYSVGDGTGGATSLAKEASVLPILPATPDAPRIEPCEACVRRQCQPEREACLKGERCQNRLRCSSPCSDPNCLSRCSDTLPPSPHFDSYFACAFGPASLCATECNVGSNWECTGAFSWDQLSYPATVDLQVIDVGEVLSTRGGPTPTWIGIEVAACSDAFKVPGSDWESECGEWFPVNEYGLAHIPLARPPLDGHLYALRGGVGAAEHQRFYSRAVSRTGSIQIALLHAVAQSGLMDNYRAVDGGTFMDPSGFQLVFAWQFDCLRSTGSTDIRIEITNDASTPVRRCLPAYGQSDPLRQFCSYVGFKRVSPQVLVVKSSLADGRAISRRTVLVEAGWSTTVVLFPMSRSEAGN